MSKRFLTLLAGVMALAALTTGCGGSDDEALTKAEYVKQANAICKKLNEETAVKYEAFYKANKDAGTAELQATVATMYLPALEERVEALNELTPPAEDEEKVEAILDALEAGIDDTASQNLIPFQATQKVFEKANKLALGYDLAYCYSA